MTCTSAQNIELSQSAKGEVFKPSFYVMSSLCKCFFFGFYSLFFNDLSSFISINDFQALFFSPISLIGCSPSECLWRFAKMILMLPASSID